MYCNNCGKVVNDNSNFCDSCGAPTNKGQELMNRQGQNMQQYGPGGGMGYRKEGFGEKFADGATRGAGACCGCLAMSECLGCLCDFC